MPGRLTQHPRAGKIVFDNEDVPDVVSVETLDPVDVPGTTPHELVVKVGALIFLVGKSSFDNSGLADGKRGDTRAISRRVLGFDVLSGD
ncbi:unnamed protein product [Scytosiphon promiscuus]